MKTWGWVSLVLLLITGTGVGGYYLGQQTHATAAAPSAPAGGEESAADKDSEPPTVAVSTVLLKEGTLAPTLEAYGSVVVQPVETKLIVAPYESQLAHLFVLPGQTVTAGTPLAELLPTPDNVHALALAQQSVQAANQTLAYAQQGVKEHLATQDEVMKAQQDLDAAQLTLTDLQSRKLTESRKVFAPIDGLITQWDAQEGSLLAPGGAILELRGAAREIKLSVAPEQIAYLTPTKPLMLFAAGMGESGRPGSVRKVGDHVSPESQMVEVFVTPPPGVAVYLDQFVRCEIPLPSVSGLQVPHEALLPRPSGFVVYRIEGQKAVEEPITIVAQNDTFAIVTGEHLKAGQAIVVVGNAELEDGMAVTDGAGKLDKADDKADDKPDATAEHRDTHDKLPVSPPAASPEPAATPAPAAPATPLPEKEPAPQ